MSNAPTAGNTRQLEVSEITLAFKYARVSMENVGTKEAPDEREQNPEAQLIPMREEMKRRGWADGGEFIDRQTGTEMYRPDFKKMFEKAGEAAKKGFDCIVMVARADRFSRFQPFDAMDAVHQLKGRNIGFYSLAEPYASDIPENTVPARWRELLLHLTFITAEAESNKISERTKAGIQAKRYVCKCGHPKERHVVGCIDCGCISFQSQWKGGRPPGSKDSYDRGAPGIKIQLSPEDMFKPSL